MALTNAQKQKRFREKRNALAKIGAAAIKLEKTHNPSGGAEVVDEFFTKMFDEARDELLRNPGEGIRRRISGAVIRSMDICKDYLMEVADTIAAQPPELQAKIMEVIEDEAFGADIAQTVDSVASVLIGEHIKDAKRAEKEAKLRAKALRNPTVAKVKAEASKRGSPPAVQDFLVDMAETIETLKAKIGPEKAAKAEKEIESKLKPAGMGKASTIDGKPCSFYSLSTAKPKPGFPYYGGPKKETPKAKRARKAKEQEHHRAKWMEAALRKE
jgi:hypothetical protein